MFRSTNRSLILPHSEHARIAGAIAAAWGNERFPFPNLPYDSVVLGIASHDRGYELIDNDGLGEVPEQRWIEIQQRGADQSCGDPVADAIVLRHLARLLRMDHSAARESVAADFIARADEIVEKCKLNPQAVAHADLLCNFCDTVAFDFCIDQPKPRDPQLWAGLSARANDGIEFHISGNERISITPWPFGATHLEGFIFGYETEDFPRELRARIVSYSFDNHLKSGRQFSNSSRE